MIDTIFNNIALTLLALVALIVLVLLGLALANPVLARLGVRNIPRRPAQSLLIVIGLTLSTIIFITSLALGDTLNYSLQRHAVDAFGAIDQIVAPPLLSLLANLDQPTDQNTATDASAGQTSTNQAGTASSQPAPIEGNLGALLALIDKGLPSISMDRYAQLKEKLASEPLVDGAAPSILFPTIIRDVNTGQGEPLGFIVAIDDSYSTEFGLHNQDGEIVKPSALRPGVGNIFELTANLFGLVSQQRQQMGFGALTLSDVARAVMGLTTLASTPLTDTVALNNAANQLGINQLISNMATLSSTNLISLTQQLGLNQTAAQISQQLGVTDTTLLGLAQAVGQNNSALQPLLTSLFGGTAPTTTTTTEITGGNPVTSTNPVTGSLGSLFGLSNNLTGASLFQALNLNTLGQQLDQYLGQYGLQLRQGEVYLNQLGADQLNARVGDTLEIFVGPIPLPYRVKGIVAESGPVGALTPVVMMRLDEAQRLLFMEGKVNNLLISNRGDNLAGMQLTSQVTDRLRQLSINEVRLNELVALLRTPPLQRAIDQEINRLQSQGAVGDEPDIPPVLRGLINDLVGSTESLQSLRDLKTHLKTQLGQADISPELRTVLVKDSTQNALRQLDLVELGDETGRQLRAGLADLNDLLVLEQLSKNTVITAANITGRAFSSLFSLFGIFSIMAGILLIFLIYVMLAAERRSEMGMARAIGVQRSHLVRMFVSEGMIYDLLAAALGVLLGLAIAYLMVGFVSGFFNSVSQQLGAGFTLFRFHFHLIPSSTVIAYCLGVLLTFLVVTFASWRVSRLNIASAIRDIPEETIGRPRSRLNRLWRWLSGPLLIAAGGWLALRASSGAQTYLLMGATLALWGLSILLVRLLERTSMRQELVLRIAYSLLGIGLLVAWAVPWNQLQGRSTFDVLVNEQGWLLANFALQAPMLILAAILVVMFNADAILGALSWLLGGISSLTPALKMAIAYPLSSRFRTAMAMVLFAMIVATVVIMAVVIQATQTIVVQDEKDTAGFELYTSFGLLSFFDPISDLEGELARLNKDDYPKLSEIEAVGAVGEQVVEARQTGDKGPGSTDKWHRLNLTGVNNGYLGQAARIYPMKLRAAGYADDAAVWKALQERDDVAVINEELLALSLNINPTGQTSQTNTSAAMERTAMLRSLQLTGVEADASQLPDLFIELRTAENPTQTQRVQVIGLLADRSTRAGGDIQMNLRAMERVTGQKQDPSTYYVKVKAGADIRGADARGADIRGVANELEKAFLSSSLNVTISSESFAQGQAITRGVLRLFQGFMAIGLLVGIAALGVISSRAVVERRQQVGMLRAIGFQSRMVALTFWLESSFIALTGILIGALTGLLLGENIVRTLFTDLTPQTNFPTPWGQIGLILLLAYGFSLLTTILPAIQASRIYPAEALRYE